MFELQKILAIPFKKAKEPVVSYLSADELKLLLEQPDTSSIYGRRDLVMLSVLYDTGARVQELVDLTVRNIRLENPAHITLTGKGDKSRQVPLLPKTVDLLRQYLAEMNLRTPDKLDYPVFTNNQKKEFTRAGVAYLLDKYAKMARTYNQLIPEKVTPHMLRHTKAMHLLQADVNIIYIRDILGHVDVATTGVYARADTKMKRAALEKADDTKLPSAIPPWAKDQDLLNWLKNLGKDV
jgi:site-specific recombinase XerD